MLGKKFKLEFVSLDSKKIPDPDLDSYGEFQDPGFVRRILGSWIRIRIIVHADPHHWF